MNARGLRDLTPLPFCFALFALSAVNNLTAKYTMNAKDFDKIRVSIKYLCIPCGSAVSFYLTAENRIFTGILFRLK